MVLWVRWLTDAALDLGVVHERPHLVELSVEAHLQPPGIHIVAPSSRRRAQQQLPRAGLDLIVGCAPRLPAPGEE